MHLAAASGVPVAGCIWSDPGRKRVWTGESANQWRNSGEMSFLRSELTYCTNVHPGQSVSEIIYNIENHVSRVRKSRGLDEMAAGLWISANAASELQDLDKRNQLIEVLRRNRLWPTSINGFPYGGFHETRVKETVYSPDWSNSARLDYTLNLADLAAALLQDAPEPFRKCAISTVPLGFAPDWSDEKHTMALQNLLIVEAGFQQVSQDSGLMITLCLEMEPGCVLETTDQTIALWKELIDLKNQKNRKSAQTLDAKASHPAPVADAGFDGENPGSIRESIPPGIRESVPATIHESQSGAEGLSHLGLCYDICHQAVMFEDVQQSLQKLKDNSIPIYKYQISSAIEARWPEAADPHYSALHEQLLHRLQGFCDNRYLHQTSIQQGQSLEHHLDLDKALERLSSSARLFWKDKPFAAGMRCRVHYHVPIHLESLDDGKPMAGLFTTMESIETALDSLHSTQNVPVLEVETYTWTVLPESIRRKYTDVVDSIAKEMKFLEDALERRGLLDP